MAVDDGTRTFTWAELHERAVRVARLLRDECGVGPDEHVAYLMQNRAEIVELILGAVLAGVWVTPINWHLAEDEVAQKLGLETPEVYFVYGHTFLFEGERVEIPSGINISLLMQDGQAGGNSGCNSYFTSYELDGFDLTFGPVGSTMMACPDGMELEQRFLQVLARVDTFRLDGNVLTLLQGTEQLATFRAL